MKVCVFAGAGGPDWMRPYIREVGLRLADADMHIVYGGSHKGIMGALASGAMSVGGRVTGVLPERIASLGHYPPGIDLITTPDMPTRKAHFWQCDAYLLLPGGVGSMDEFFEAWCNMKLGYDKTKPLVVYDIDGLYDGLRILIKDMVRAGFMPQERADMVTWAYSPLDIVPALTGPTVAAPWPTNESIG
jgi:uncharacterized protein (TIGR00730 family)